MTINKEKILILRVMTLDKEKILISRIMTLDTSNMREVTQHFLSRV